MEYIIYQKQEINNLNKKYLKTNKNVMKKHNFNAGPSVLPDVVIKKAAEAVLDFNGSGLSILSISHRTKEFDAVMDEAKALFRELLEIPDNYQIFFVDGNGTFYSPKDATASAAADTYFIERFFCRYRDRGHLPERK